MPELSPPTPGRPAGPAPRPPGFRGVPLRFSPSHCPFLALAASLLPVSLSGGSLAWVSDALLLPASLSAPASVASVPKSSLVAQRCRLERGTRRPPSRWAEADCGCRYGLAPVSPWSQCPLRQGERTMWCKKGGGVSPTPLLRILPTFRADLRLLPEISWPQIFPQLNSVPSQSSSLSASVPPRDPALIPFSVLTSTNALIRSFTPCSKRTQGENTLWEGSLSYCCFTPGGARTQWILGSRFSINPHPICV